MVVFLRDTVVFCHTAVVTDLAGFEVDSEDKQDLITSVSLDFSTHRPQVGQDK